MRVRHTLIGILIVTIGWTRAPFAKPIESEADCPGTDEAVTSPAPTDAASVLATMTELKTSDGKPALELSSELVKEVHGIFDASQIKTKMEQFYRLLFAISGAILPVHGKQIVLDAPATRSILLGAKVFTDPRIPNQIMGVAIDKRKKHPRYHVTFRRGPIEVLLNKGEGFYLYRNGLCQHAQKLIFSKEFWVSLKMNRKGNMVARDFRGVDLFGDFGNRGIIDVDVNYIEFRKVEFYKGTPNGKVTAYVSREEFRKNDHNPLLRIITRFVPDRSVQPIDW